MLGIFLGHLGLKDKLDIVKTSKNIEFKGGSFPKGSLLKRDME